MARKDGFLRLLRSCMTHPMKDVRLDAVRCAERLALSEARSLREASIDITLGHIVRDHSHGGLPLQAVAVSPSSGLEPSQEVRDTARIALRMIEQGEDIQMALS